MPDGIRSLKRAVLATLLVSGAVLAQGFILYGASGRDDAYITYWAAKSLSDLGRIVNVNHDSIEQSSSLLHVLILAALHALSGVPFATLGPITSALAAVGAIVATMRLAFRLALPYAAWVGLILSLSPYLVYWALGGLESTLAALLALLFCWALGSLLERPATAKAFLAGGTGALYTALRPEGILVVLTAIAFLGGLLWLRGAIGPSFRRGVVPALAVVATIAAGVFGLLVLWRIETFGSFFPQPVSAKGGLDGARLIAGLRYLLRQGTIPSLVFLSGFAIFGVARGWRREDAAASGTVEALAAFVAAQTSFVVFAGGDWMEAGRFLVPAIPMLAILALVGISCLRPALCRAVLVLLPMIAVYDSVHFARTESAGIPGIRAPSVYGPVLRDFGLSRSDFSWFELANRPHLRDLPVTLVLDDLVLRLLNSGEDSVSFLSSQMGYIPFHLATHHPRKVEFVDRLGLVTSHTTTCPDFRAFRTWIGTEVGYAEILTRIGGLRSRCDIPRPDVIYDLLDPRQQGAVERNGYSVVYLQGGRIGGYFLDGGSFEPAAMFVAVRDDLLPRIGRLKRRGYSFTKRQRAKPVRIRSRR